MIENLHVFRFRPAVSWVCEIKGNGEQSRQKVSFSPPLTRRVPQSSTPTALLLLVRRVLVQMLTSSLFEIPMWLLAS